MRRRYELVDFLAISAGSLFLELVLIRYLSAEIRIFAYFANLVLVICFLGLGLGYAITTPKLPLSFSIAITGILVACTEPAVSQVIPFREISDLLSFSDLNTWSRVEAELPEIVSGISMLLLLLVLIASAFVPLGQALGTFFDEAPRGERLRLYSWNVAASLAGILGFQLFGALWLPPSLWITAGLGLILLPLRREPVALVLSFSIVTASAWMAMDPGRPDERVYWSPYQKLELGPVVNVQSTPGGGVETTPYFGLTVNSTVYQYLLDFRPETTSARPVTFPPASLPFLYYEVPHRIVEEASSVLVVGSGTGNDVAAALRNGAKSVDAVEIDPTILEIGRFLHAENPYGDPRVRVIVDDARAFFHRSDRRYDLIVFGLLDSHRLTSNFSNTSLDSYVYTLESFRAARELLSESGVMAVSFQVARGFIGNRLEETLSRVFGKFPITLRFFEEESVVRGTGGAIFLAGDQKRIEEALAAHPPLGSKRITIARPPLGHVEVATDDWPYLYIQDRSIPTLWRIVGLTVLVGVIAILVPVGFRAGRVDRVFFLLGFAFMLLETQTISRFALAFGATATVSAAVIAGILVMILIGNGLVANTAVRPTWWVFAGLAATALTGASVSIDQLAAASPWVRTAVLAVTVAPLLFAAIAFARAFETTPDPRGAMLSNLIGAVAGGLAQCLSFVVGQSALVWLVVFAYALAWMSGLTRIGAVSTRA